MIFKYQQFEQFLVHMKHHGSFQTFSEWKDEHVFLLRHDIDFDLELAYEIAKIEHQNNVRATYFILVSGEYYNVFQHTNQVHIQNIRALGHEIGLHFDPTQYPHEKNLAERVHREAGVLSSFIGEDVTSISLHNPSVHGQYPLFKEYVNAYSADIFSDENYLADSCYNFRGKDPFEFIKKVKNQVVQVLLHPMHFSKSGGGYDDVIPRVLRERLEKFHRDFLTANPTYKKQLEEPIINLLNLISNEHIHPQHSSGRN